MTTTTKTLDYIICPFDATDENYDEQINDADAKRHAESLGWDTSDTEVIHVHPSAIDQHINSGCAYRHVDHAADYAPHPSWISCMVVSWSDVL